MRPVGSGALRRLRQRLPFPPMTGSEDLRRAMAAFPTGVTIVTASGNEGSGPAGATANAVTTLSLGPPLMLACLDRGSRTLEAVREAGRFGLNGLAADQADLAESFADPATRESRWEGIEWDERAGAPRITSAPLWVCCELRDMIDGGDHLIITGSVEEVEADREREPLVFHLGSYRGLA